MKTIHYILIFVLALAACEDYNDQFYSELDKAGKATNPTSISYMLTDEDYETIGDLIEAQATTDEEKALGDKLKNQMYFDEEVSASKYVPLLLADKYVGFDNKSEVKVLLKNHAGGLEYLDKIAASEDYTLSTADYDTMGGDIAKYNNFSGGNEPEDYLPDFLTNKYPDAEEGSVYRITYDYYAGSVNELTALYELNGSSWSEYELGDSYILKTEDYDWMGEPGNYDNFSSSVKPEDYLPTFLDYQFPFANAGDKKVVMYAYYSGGVKFYGNELRFDGNNWAMYTGVIETEETFSVNDFVWAWVPPIVFVETTETATEENTYTLTDADYALVDNDDYNNFDVRAGADEEPIEVRIEKITKILKNNFDIEIGDVYKVYYDVYDGTNDTWDITLKAIEDN